MFLATQSLSKNSQWQNDELTRYRSALPHVYTHVLKDHVRTLKILLSMPEFGDL